MKIEFDRTIYDKNAIYEAIRLYKEIADITYTQTEDKIMCSIEAIHISEQMPDMNEDKLRKRVADEFGNFALDLTVTLGKSKIDMA